MGGAGRANAIFRRAARLRARRVLKSAKVGRRRHHRHWHYQSARDDGGYGNRRTGEPDPRSAIVWQCRRTAAYCEALTPRELIEKKTGLVVDAYFSASKIRWLLDSAASNPDDLLFGNVDTWLIWKLTNGAVHATDPTNASRTMLMNLASGEWDPKLLDIFEIPAHNALPKIVPSSGVCGASAQRIPGARKFPSPASRGISRRHCSARRAFLPASRRTPTVPGVSH